MSRNFVAPLGLVDLAAGQWGLFTTSQAKREGLSAQALSRLTDDGYLERVRHGVYRITGTPPGPADRLRAVWLGLRPDLAAYERLTQEAVGAVVSHRSAAQLHQLGDLDADYLEFTAVERRQTRDPEVRFYRGELPRSDWTRVDGLPVTTPLRTVADLAQARLDGGHLAGVVRDAITTLHLDPHQVAQALRQYAHHYAVPLGDGEALVSDLLQQAGVPESTRTAVELAANPQRQRAFDSLARAIANHARQNDGQLPGLRTSPQVEALIQAIADAQLHLDVPHAGLSRALVAARPQYESLQRALSQAAGAMESVRIKPEMQTLLAAAAEQIAIEAEGGGRKRHYESREMASNARQDQHTEA